MVEISTDKMAKYINKLIKINDELTSRTRHNGHNDNAIRNNKIYFKLISIIIIVNLSRITSLVVKFPFPNVYME